MGDLEHALSAYENALRHNPTSVSGLTQVAGIARIKENYPKVNFFICPCLSAENNISCLSLLYININSSYLGSRLFPASPSD